MDGHATNGDKNESNLVQKKQEASEVEAYKNQSDDAEFRSVMPVMMFIFVGIGLAFLLASGLR